MCTLPDPVRRFFFTKLDLEAEPLSEFQICWFHGKAGSILPSLDGKFRRTGNQGLTLPILV